MGKIYLHGLGIICLALATPCYAQAAKKTELNLVEITNKKFSTHVLFDFTGNVDYQRQIIPEKRQLCITFGDMSSKTFNMPLVLERLDQLKKQGLIKNMSINEAMSSGKKPTPCIVLTFEFNDETSPSLIKWSKVNRSNRFIVEFFSKEKLDKLKKDRVLLYASNDIQQYDVPPQADKKKNQSLLIMLDAGHGGTNLGARGHGNILEKDVTLDITKHVHTLLKQRGYESVLTRSHDHDLSLVERSQRAQDEGADLFVSIHANSSGSGKTDVQGVETFYMENNDLLSRSSTTGFLFVNCEKDITLVNELDEQVSNHAAQSKNLASSVQANLLQTITQEGFNSPNRGIKRGEYRVFLQSGMPTALVEVGFLTNPQEAKLLGKHSYRKLLAEGICNGIIAHVTSGNCPS